jgi:hypothetical protein
MKKVETLNEVLENAENSWERHKDFYGSGDHAFKNAHILGTLKAAYISLYLQYRNLERRITSSPLPDSLRLSKKIITITYLTNGKYVANNLYGDLLFTGETAEEVEEWAADHEYDIQELVPAVRKARKGISRLQDKVAAIYADSQPSMAKSLHNQFMQKDFIPMDELRDKAHEAPTVFLNTKTNQETSNH